MTTRGEHRRQSCMCWVGGSEELEMHDHLPKKVLHFFFYSPIFHSSFDGQSCSNQSKDTFNRAMIEALVESSKARIEEMPFPEPCHKACTNLTLLVTHPFFFLFLS